MNEFNSLAMTLNQSFSDLWAGVISFLPSLLIAIIIFIVGWIVGAILSRVITQLLRSLKLDQAFKNTSVERGLEKAGFQLNVGKFIGELVKWFVIAVFLVASLDVLGLEQVNDFLQRVVLVFLPQLFVAVLILLAGALIAEVTQNVVRASANSARLPSANFLGKLAKWAVWIFAALAAMYELGIAAAFVQTLFTGVVVALALAFGLAFGLGGQEEAARYLKKAREEMSRRE